MQKTGTSFDFWWKWLVASCILTGAFGGLLMLAPALTRALFSLIIFGRSDALTGFATLPAAYLTLLHGVLGAVIVGWSASLLALLQGRFRERDAAAWKIFMFCIMAWFVPDTTFSLLAGFWQNALFNCAFLVLFAPGLWGTRPRSWSSVDTPSLSIK
jgi:hypothetical protein